ncbi:solute carrier family 2, facilitated glucose transporter member 3-like [Lycorma delicatula]|uniref:solute carrier family 2, facilitated glucose transporter member 3-like n=1 Tax=Lycorma delicatula TaxID=130591 RepID=UPI003F51261A
MAKYTVPMGLTVKLLFATIVAGVGSGFQHGYNTGVVNAPGKLLSEWMSEVYETRSGKKADENFITFLWSFAVSIYCVGGILGGLMTSLYASILGRKGGLIANNIFAIIAGLLMGFSKKFNSPEMFVVGRFFTGYNCGLNSGLCAMYLVEIAPTVMRGAIGSVYQLIVTISILISQICGLDFVLGTDSKWPILLGLISIVAVGQMLLLPCCPETPKYLYGTKKEEKAKAALVWLRGDNIDEELNEIKAECDKEQSLGKTTCGQMFSQKILRKPLIISICIMLAQQLSGINAVIYYSTATFRDAGFSQEAAQNGTLGMGAMNILMTIISLFLVDIFGRKTLLLAGFGFMFLVTCALTVTLKFINEVSVFSAISVVLVILFVVSFAIGAGSIPWFLVGEFFTQDARPLAASLAVAANWIANFCVSLLFLPIQAILGPLVFIIFAVLQILFFLYILIQVPETKNKTYEEISANFQ